MNRHPYSMPLALLALLAPLAAAGQQEGAPAAQPLTPAAAQVQAPGAPAAELAGSHRVLDSHRFEPSSLVDDPFSSSSVGLRVGYLFGSASGPKLTGPPIAVTCCRDLSYAGFGGDFNGSIRFADWLALRLGLSTTVYSGLDRPSVITVGSGLKTSIGGQLVSGFDLGDRLRAGFLLGLTEAPALDILVLSGLLDAYRNGAVTDAEILQVSGTLTLDAGGSLAWAIAPYLGLTASAEYLAPRKKGAAVFSANGISGAAALDLDVGKLLAAAPFGVSVAYRIIAPIGSSTPQAQHDVRAGLFYTGRPGLTFRGELGYRKFHLREEQLLSDAGALDFFVQYDW